LLRESEFLEADQSFEYVDVNQYTQHLSLGKGTLCFTYCQVPIVYHLSNENRLGITFQNGTITVLDDLNVDAINSLKIFERTGEVVRIDVQLKPLTLK
jgi:hypothetical protein